MTSKILDRFAKMSLVCLLFDSIGPFITFLLLSFSICPRASSSLRSLKHQKKKKAKVAEQEKEKPKKRKAKHIILSEEEEDEEVDSEWIPEKHAGEVEVTVV